MQITCNVCLALPSKPSMKLIKLESVDITQRVIDESDRLTMLDITTQAVALAVLSEFKDEHPELVGTGLTYTVTMRVW